MFKTKYLDRLISSARSEKLFLAGCALALFASACSSGGGDDDAGSLTRSVELEGQLERETPNADGTRDPIVGYQICSFGVCDTTDAKGKFEFFVAAPSKAQSVDFSVSGTNFATSISVPLRSSTVTLEVTLLKEEDKVGVELAEVEYNGVVDTEISNPGFNDGD